MAAEGKVSSMNLMDNLDTFDALIEAERTVMLAEYVKRTGDTAEIRIAAVDDIKQAKRRLYALVDNLTPDQGRDYAKHRSYIFSDE